LKKSATIVTNDPNNAEFELTMQGEVDSFATITPPYLRLNGNVGEKISGKVVILFRKNIRLIFCRSKP
jgi:hypothetical protein